MPELCAECGRYMEICVRAEVKPTDLFDDATVLLLRCPTTFHSACLVLRQFERRGALDDETVDSLEIPLTFPVLRWLRSLVPQCPNLNDAKCECALHQEWRAEAILTRQPSLARKPEEPFIPEDESEENIYYYGRTN